MAKFAIEPVQGGQKRFTGLIWAEAGIGKTTLACTAPGKKLLCMTDPDGEASVAAVPDVHVMDLTIVNNVDEYIAADPFGILKAVDEHGFDTVIFDGLTNAVDQVLTKAIAITNGSSERRVAIASYQMRGRYILRLIKTLNTGLRKRGVHFIVLAHQDSPIKSEEGALKGYTLMIGGQLQISAPVDFSEVWCIMDNSKGRQILIRPSRMRSPMKTRMFTTLGSTEFVWKYNPETLEGDGIATWWDAYVAGGFKKLPLPK